MTGISNPARPFGTMLTAMVTPFKADLSVDYDAAAQLAVDLVALGNEEAIREAPRQYLNRLSDLMFVLARVLNRMHGGDDVYWKSERMKAADA